MTSEFFKVEKMSQNTSESHLPAKKRLLWRLPEFWEAVVVDGGVNKQSHIVTSESTEREVVKDVLSEDHACTPKESGSECVVAVSPIFNPVPTLSHGQDRDLRVGSSLPDDPFLLVNTDCRQSIQSDRRSESQWDTWTAGSFPRVVPELRYTSEVTGSKLNTDSSCGQGAKVIS